MIHVEIETAPSQPPRRRNLGIEILQNDLNDLDALEEILARSNLNFAQLSKVCVMKKFSEETFSQLMIGVAFIAAQTAFNSSEFEWEYPLAKRDSKHGRELVDRLERIRALMLTVSSDVKAIASRRRFHTFYYKSFCLLTFSLGLRFHALESSFRAELGMTREECPQQAAWCIAEDYHGAGSDVICIPCDRL